MHSVIVFDFCRDKAIGAMAYLAKRLSQVDKAKLLKLLYFADRDHFLSSGRPITGATQCAMPWGPLPSECLDLLNGLTSDEALFEFISLTNNRITPTNAVDSGIANLSSDEIEELDRVLEAYGDWDTWKLVNHTHSLPEYRDTYVEGTSTPIPYEVMLKHYAPDRMLFSRPVVSPLTAAHMRSPFPRAEPDL